MVMDLRVQQDAGPGERGTEEAGLPDAPLDSRPFSGGQTAHATSFSMRSDFIWRMGELCPASHPKGPGRVLCFSSFWEDRLAVWS